MLSVGGYNELGEFVRRAVDFQSVNSLSRLLIFIQRGGSALDTWVWSVVEKLTSYECSEACCQPGGAKGANFGWV